MAVSAVGTRFKKGCPEKKSPGCFFLR